MAATGVTITWKSGSASASMTAKFTYLITSNHTSWTFELSALDIEFSQSGSGTDLTKARSKRETAMQSGIPLKFYYGGSVVYSTTIEGTPDHPRPWMGPDVTRTVIKTHAAQTLMFYAEFNGKAGTKYTQTIPARTSYKVTYNGNGAASPAAATKWHDETLTLHSALARTGYVFRRWNTNTSDTGTAYAAGGSYTANSGNTLYAIWNPVISYNANGGSGAPASQTKTFGTTLTLTTAKPTRAGYVFNSWNTKADGSGTRYASGASYTSNTAATLYAIWNPVISYNANGGSGAPASQTKTFGTALTLTTAKPTRAGYSFYRWNTKADGSGTWYASGASYTSNTAVTLYAIWTPVVSYNANGGSGAPASQTKPYGSALTLSSTVPTRTNYKFLGWGTSASDATPDYQPGGSYTSGATATLYAIWKRIYSPPALTIVKAYRSDASGATADEGTCVTVVCKWSIFDTETAEGDSSKANSVVSLTAECNGESTTAAAGDVQGLSGTTTLTVNAYLDTETPADVTVTILDRGGTFPGVPVEKSVTIPVAFYPLDILAGGHGIAFGMPATRDGCMEIGFGDLLFSADTTDALYLAIDGLGWNDDVLVD